MATLVGQEPSLRGLISDLIHLEYDAIAAYDTTIEKLENPTFKERIAEFKEDHLRHLRELQSLATASKINPPSGGDYKQMLTTGKVKVAAMMGDKAILQTMKTNEDDTVTAYERASRHEMVEDEDRELFERALSDEIRHREWMDRTASEL
jgi:rubrerythrin